MEQLKKQGDRQSNLELLRIVAMLMVILVHYAGHGGGRLVPLPDGAVYGLDLYFGEWFQKTQAIALNAGGQIGVNIFFLISGYFLCTTTFKTERLLKTLAQVFFYSAVMVFMLTAFGIMEFPREEWFKIFFPVMNNQYWFATAYVLLYLVSPFFNIVVKNATQKQFLWLLAVLVTMSSVVPTIVGLNEPYYMLFVVLYFIAAYIRIYGLTIMKKPLGAFLAYIAVYFGICVAMVWKHLTFDGTAEAKDAVVDYMSTGHKLWCLAASVLLFLAFKNLKIKNNKVINLLAGASFGVYLIHDNKYFRRFLWDNIVQTEKYFYNNAYILYAVATAVAIYLACAVIDIIRLYALEKPLILLYRKIVPKIINRKKEKA